MSEDQGLEEDDSGAVMRAVGRQIKLWREAAGLRQAELGAAIGYGEELVSAVERARRIPRPEFLDKADEVLGADGKIAAMKKDVAEARSRRRYGTWRGWRRRRSSCAPTTTRSSRGSCRPRNTRGRLS